MARGIDRAPIRPQSSPSRGARFWEAALRAIRLLILVIAVCGLSAPATAQNTSDDQPATAASAPATQQALEAELDDAQASLQAVARSARRSQLGDAEIGQLQAELPSIQAKVFDALTQLTPRLASVDARLAQLGPAPGPGQPAEDPDIAKTRRDLTRFRQEVDGDVKQANLLQVEAQQLTGLLAGIRKTQFAARLRVHSRSVLDPGLWAGFAAAAPADVDHAGQVLGSESATVSSAWRRPGGAGGLILAVLVALLIAVPGRLWLERLGYRQVATVVPDSRLRRTGLALWLLLVGVLTPLAALLLVRGALVGAGAVTPTAAEVAMWLTGAIVFATYFEALGRAVLSPRKPSWRLAPVPDAVAGRLAPYPAAIGLAGGLAMLFREGGAALGLSDPTQLAATATGLILEVIAVGAALMAAGRARSERLAEAVEDTTPREAESRLPWVVVALLAWLTVGATLIAMLTGYLALASFLMRNMIWIGTVLATLFLLLRLSDDLFPAVLSPDRAVGRFAQIAIGLSRGALEQLAVLLSGIVRLALLLFGWAAILAPFGDSAGDIAGRLTSSQLAFKIGQVSISPGTIIGAIFVFFIGLAITRAIRGWLEQRYLPKTRLDVGLRTSVSAGVTYFGAVVAVLLTCGYLGLSLDKIALFASALSVGIGFGLQSVIGNFVSGLILLAERPVKVGDWIAIGDLEGDVKRINVRATEIEMQDRSKLIVPNSDLISKTVRNVSHGGAIGRTKIVLKVVDSADPAEVKALLLKRITSHPDVLKDPPVGVYLSDVRDGALEFSAFLYVASPRVAFRVKSELLFQIVPDLRDKGIALANSTPVVNVGLGDRQIEPTPDGTEAKSG
jgi:potassium efflux system protein